MLSFSFYSFIPHPSQLFFSLKAQTQYAPHSTTLPVFVQYFNRLLIEGITSEMGNRLTANFFTGELNLPSFWEPHQNWKNTCVGGGKETNSCNFKMLFLVTVKCGKSKSLSLGCLWEGKLKIWERRKFRSPGGIVSLSTQGGLCGHRFVESLECLFTLD